MPRSYNRFIILLGSLILLLLVMTLLYMLGMYLLETNREGSGRRCNGPPARHQPPAMAAILTWQHPLMVIYVVIAQFIGVMLLFLVFPIYLIPFLEERFETSCRRNRPTPRITW